MLNLLSEPLLPAPSKAAARRLAAARDLGVLVLCCVCALQLFFLHRSTDRVVAVAGRAVAPTTRLRAAGLDEGSSALPPTFLLDGLTPSADQALRGDCWLFAVSGLLEDSYRRFGVSHGWFGADSYLRLSRQALGIGVMEICRRQPNSFCPAANAADLDPTAPADAIAWANTTEGHDGADEHLLFWLRTLGSGRNVLPDAVCAYATKPDWRLEAQCPGLAEARVTNPLRFTVTGFESFYERTEMKAALRRHGQPLSLGLSMAYAPHYVPCELWPGCEPASAKCVPCPLERVYAGHTCCVEQQKAMVSMKGEWFHFADEPLVMEGGHAINIVGWSDTYRTEHGEVGGFIVRNTWADGLGTAHGLKARGSHTAAYFHGEVYGGHSPSFNLPKIWLGEPVDSASAGRSPLMHMEASTNNKAIKLRCLDTGMVLPTGSCDSSRDYYLHAFTEYGGRGLFTACFFHIDQKNDGDAGELCLPPLTIDDVATVLTPSDEDFAAVGLNDKALCGYNFVPYATLEAMQIRFGGFSASRFEIEWLRESYPSRASRKYELVNKSTHKLGVPKTFAPAKFY